MRISKGDFENDFDGWTMVQNLTIETGTVREGAKSLKADDPDIQYSLEERASVTISIYEIQGRRVRTLVPSSEQVGSHSVVWDRRSNTGHLVPAGIYFVRLTTADVQIARKMVVVR